LVGSFGHHNTVNITLEQHRRSHLFQFVVGQIRCQLDEQRNSLLLLLLLLLMLLLVTTTTLLQCFILFIARSDTRLQQRIELLGLLQVSQPSRIGTGDVNDEVTRVCSQPTNSFTKILRGILRQHMDVDTCSCQY
jgi:hypothetical protein